FCLLLHHYQPTLLPRERIVNAGESADRGSGSDGDLDDSLTFSYSSPDGAEQQEARRQADKANLTAAFVAMRELGGVPVLSGWTDYSGTLPDRRLVLVTLAHLCGRLLEGLD
ncbi:abnormal spindle-like microcephaly-associated protein homolog, partial [Pollicipes pollicipes]|uniref:abnormal spindle-like microcephaly-associated protein homolog n=1 Tax=Pollicipes pollicipes TaxID=41117 RepID=UPI001884AC2B